MWDAYRCRHLNWLSRSEKISSHVSKISRCRQFHVCLIQQFPQDHQEYIFLPNFWIRLQLCLENNSLSWAQIVATVVDIRTRHDSISPLKCPAKNLSQRSTIRHFRSHWPKLCHMPHCKPITSNWYSTVIIRLNQLEFSPSVVSAKIAGGFLFTYFGCAKQLLGS